MAITTADGKPGGAAHGHLPCKHGWLEQETFPARVSGICKEVNGVLAGASWYPTNRPPVIGEQRDRSWEASVVRPQDRFIAPGVVSPTGAARRALPGPP